MGFRSLRDEVRSIVESAVERAGFPRVAIDVVEPMRAEFGDISSSAPISLSAQLRKPPRVVAKELADLVVIPKASAIESFDPHPSGYLNFRLNRGRFSKLTLQEAMSEGFGTVDLGKGRRVLVEHTSVNPAHQLHVGHLRNVFLGDSVARILRSTGYSVHVLNWIDDLGLQVADVIVGVKYAGLTLEPARDEKFDHHIGDSIYVKVNQLYETNQDLIDKQKMVLKEIEDEGSELGKLSQEITLRVLKEQLKTCWRVGARYDCLNFESHTIRAKLWDELFKLLKERGIAVYATSGKLADCWIVVVPGEEEGEEKVLVRSDGTATYVAKDLPYAAWKVGLIPDLYYYTTFAKQPDETLLWSTTGKDGVSKHPEFSGANLAINVIDVRQSRLQRLVSFVLGQLGGAEYQSRYIHLGYEVVSLSRATAESLGLKIGDEEVVHMSGRKGIFVSADAVLDMLHTKIFEEAKKRNPAESEEWLHKVAEKMAVAAIRWSLLKPEPGKLIIFDLQRSMNLIGDTGPYLQYSYARATRIVEKSGVTPEPRSADRLTSDLEFTLVKWVSKLDSTVEEAAVNLQPNLIAKYAYRLAVAFNEFYEALPVLKEKDEDMKHARLALVEAFRRALSTSLNLLGIEALERV